ncbi:restriction endonuclease subunit S [Acinetobacter baumannii]|uniref:restriction endonuclease subunit S n=1 Tax=Acinetobacter baumannii TaxID=470 RepID=UPI003757C8C8
MTVQFPKSWAKTELKNLVTYDGLFKDGDWIESKDQDPNGEVRLIQLADIGDNFFIDKSNRFLTHNKAIELNCNFIKNGDILIARMPEPLGRACIFPLDGNEKYVTVVDVAILRTNDDIINNKWLIYFINSPYIRAEILSLQAGTTRKRISRKNLELIQFPVPPYKEQIRIADKIDELFSELDNGIEELEKAQKKLELYRQSLLKSAVEGELSKEWRENQTEVSETGEQLLSRILKERREHWEQEKLKEFAEKGKKTPKDWQNKYPEPVQPDTENLPQLPRGWVWASLDQVTLIKGGIQKKPSRAPVNNKFPFLRVANVYRAQLNLDDIHEIELFGSEIERYKLEKGDLLIVEGNGSLTEIGRCAIWDGSIPNAVHQNHLIRARPIHVLSQYLETWLNSSDGINYMAKLAVTTSGLYSLSVGKIAQIPVPLPPLNEQFFITIDLASKLEQQKQQLMNLKELQNLNKLQKKNILSDAFTGKLIPQDPNDEPAQVLLGRIQQQSEAEALVKKAPPQKRSTQKVKKEVAMSKNILDILKKQSDWISGQELATAFGLNGNSKIEEVEQFYEQLRTLSQDDKITVKPDQQNSKEQDLIKLKDNPNAS